jgi:Fe2+ or Zn2+ uptake regulation protein
MEALCRTRRPLDPDEILARARKTYTNVGMATVYRTLDMLDKLCLCTRVQIGNKAYILTCDEPNLHVHLVCSKCRNVSELADDESLIMLQRRMAASGFVAKARAIELVGLCERCQ